MKKIIALAMAVVMLAGVLTVTAAEIKTEETADVYFSFGNKTNAIAQEKITVSDVDEDGALTINDAFICAHDAKFQGGAKAGYVTEMGKYGLFITKFWGIENGGNFGYYVNHTMANSLTDKITDGAYLDAYAITDTTSWSDKYCFFECRNITADPEKEISLKLKAIEFDANYAPVEVPVKDAFITFNGEKTEFKTDAEGNVNIKFNKGGKYVISAVSDSTLLVPPVARVNVTLKDTVDVFVTVSDNKGDIKLAQEKITVSDVDRDYELTIDDALKCAHDAEFPGGAKAGYVTENGKYGLFITKLWGIENGGSYGYYLNNKMAMGLLENVKDGDYLNAFAYKDAANYSDAYCYFDVKTVSSKTGEEISLTLKKLGFDANYNPVELPLEGAVITLNGKATEYKTDANGKAVIKVADAGDYVISAIFEGAEIVPPVVKANIAKAADEADNKPENKPDDVLSPQTGDCNNSWFILSSVLSLGAVLLSVKKLNEN